MRYIDFRSDTVTQPTPEMRAAMAAADVGDDVYQDDPTTNQLEALAARMLGKEKALFISSGTMGNQLAIMGMTRKGDEIIVSADSHIVTHEAGATAPEHPTRSRSSRPPRRRPRSPSSPRRTMPRARTRAGRITAPAGTSGATAGAAEAEENPPRRPKADE